jgi:diguanylate cyclase (GGDEF)-like protein
MRVLVAEDSATPRVMLERALTNLGHECLVAEDGTAAWELFVRHGADVVISDWMMPGMDGDELCRRVRESSVTSYSYFILLTSLEESGYVLRGMEAGADDYLKKPFDIEDLKARLIAASRVTQLHERLRVQQAELEKLNARLFDESRNDPLTAVGNRIALREQLEQLAARAERSGRPYALALYDIDLFKSYNDSCGHQAGDEVLRAVADALVDQCRQGDTVYRFGGEELLVVFPNQTLDTAAIAAERLRCGVEALGIAHDARGAGAVVTVSGGIAQLEPSDGGDVEALLKRADLALYRAKELGRNRIEQAPGSVAAHDTALSDASDPPLRVVHPTRG